MNHTRTRQFGVAAFLTIAAAAFAPAVAAWSDQGHRIAAYVAEGMLTPKARAAVNDLLEGASIADTANWLDIYREALKREIPNSDKWHYDNRSICRDIPYTEYCAGDNCATAQIPRWFAVLADANEPRPARLMALRVLLHVVPDLHQPLHAADDEDWGGGKKTVQLPAAADGSVPPPRTLHLAWDIDFVRAFATGFTESRAAKELMDANWRRFPELLRGDPQQWAAESHGIARRLAYGQLEGFSCGELEGRKVGFLNGKRWPEGEVYRLSTAYVEGATAIVPQLLLRGGVRAGGLINAALDPLPPGTRIPPPAAPKAGEAVPRNPPSTSSLQEAMARERARIEQSAPKK